jgi:hypothetical protein
VTVTAAAQSGESRPADRSTFPVLLIASLVSSLIMLDSNIVAVSLPAIGRSLSASFTDVQWVISAYVLTYASLLLASGNYADLRGRKKSMISVRRLWVFGDGPKSNDSRLGDTVCRDQCPRH